MRTITPRVAVAVLSGALAGMSPLADAATTTTVTRATTPIKHLIVVIGENVSFDTLFGTYAPKRGATILNLVSQGIVNADGTPGPNYGRAVQSGARNDTTHFSLNPRRTGALAKLPQPMLTGAYDPVTFKPYGNVVDARFATLQANGPFQITRYAPYADAIGDPPHRFFQMWQQTRGSNEKLDLFNWVATTVGTGGATEGVSADKPGQGGELMGFFNMNQGDAPYFRQLAQDWAISDNYHQAVMGGTGANFFALATGDVAVYRIDGKLAKPPANQIENPDPVAGTSNFYINDGYSGGSYVNCADAENPGVAAVQAVLDSLGRANHCEPGAYYLLNNYGPPFEVDGSSKPLGEQAYVYPAQIVPTIGEALSKRHVTWGWYTGGRDDADVTSDAAYPTLRAQLAAAMKKERGMPADEPDESLEPELTALAIKKARPYIYNDIGDPLNASSIVVGTPALKAGLKGLASFYAELDKGTLPAVSFVIPKNMDSGHPGYSAPARYEAFLKDFVSKVQARKALWSHTAIVITTDEGGGYFDTGNIQTLDFFGDGPRVPLLLVSPYARRGHVDHTYQDHASILKFIERNWRVPPLSARSRDNLPLAKHDRHGTYLPANQPAIGDLTTLFDFAAPARR